MSGNNRTFVAAAVLAACVALAVLWLLLSDSNAVQPRLNTPGNDVEAAKPVPRHGNHSPDLITSPAESSSNQGSQSDNLPPGPMIVRVKCLDHDARPVDGLQIRYHGGQALIHDSHRLATTGDDGIAQLPIDRAGPVHIVAVSDEWNVEAKVEPAGLRELVTLTAHRLISVYVAAVLDNGEPFIGPCLARVLTSPRWTGGATFDGRAFHELKKVPINRDIHFRFHETMIGVDEQTFDVPAAQIEPLGLITLRLKRNPANEKGAIELDLSGYEGRNSVQVAVTHPGGSTSWVGGSLRGDTWRSFLAPPGRYVIKLTGGPAWESEEFTVEPRKVTRVAYARRVPATVRVTIVDEDRAAVAGAILTTATDTYVNFDHASLASGTAARGGADGNVELDGLRPGLRKFLVEAPGFEPHTFELELAEGEQRTIPEIQLKRATGRIEVTLTGMKEGQAYSILLLQPGGGTVRTVKRVQRILVDLEGLPLRKYVVAVIAGSGGNVASQNVDLTAESPKATVVVDVANLKKSPPTATPR